MGKWVVRINGSEYATKTFTIDKNHPSQDPDTFEITLNGNQTIAKSSPVEMRRYGVVKYYGYVEESDVTTDDGGTITKLSGRCRKLILWKKYNERFTDTRMDGFFGRVYSHELVKFMLRCPKSDVPIIANLEEWDKDYPRHRIGWGMDSGGWGMDAEDNVGANLYAAGTDPAYPKLRLSGFYWRNRGTPFNNISRVPDATTGAQQWTEVGAAGVNCINTDDGDTTYISESTDGETSYGYHLQNLGGTADGINTVSLFVKIRRTLGFEWQWWSVLVEIHDGTSWYTAGTMSGTNNAYQEVKIDGLESIINTVTKFNNMQVRFTLQTTGSWFSEMRITYVYGAVSYSTGGSQEVGDKFIIDMGQSKTRICGIIIQSRNKIDTYPRNYIIDYSTDGVAWNWLAPITSPVGGNAAQDIIHSWTPMTMRAIRIRITAQDVSHPWEITQIYIYQADDADYTVLQSTKSANVVLNEDCLLDKTTIIGPLNIPYQRLTETMDQLALATYDGSYNPTEWWIDQERGWVYFGGAKGTDKSAITSLQGSAHMGKTKNKSSIKKTAQRVRVLGKGEGRRQDEVTSNWQVDGPAITAAGTFYEELVSDKSISYSYTANELAKVWLTKLKDILYEREVDIEYDPYNYPNQQYDTGDNVTIVDVVTGIASASYRIEAMHVSENDDGEHISLVVTNRWEDISDRVADMYRKIRKLELTGTSNDEWTGDGSNQSNMKQDKIENYWEMKSKYDDSDELQKVEDWANQNSYYVNPATGSDPNVGSVAVAKDILMISGPTANAVGTPQAQIGDPSSATVETRTIAWDRDPRFSAKFRINDAFLANGNYIIFGMEDLDSGSMNRFGFYIYYDSGAGTYTLYAMLSDEGFGMWTRNMGTLSLDTIYEIEAKVDWDDKIVFYKLGLPDSEMTFQAAIPFDENVINRTLTPMWIYCNLSGDGASPAAYIEFMLWKSQGKKESVI